MMGETQSCCASDDAPCKENMSTIVIFRAIFAFQKIGKKKRKKKQIQSDNGTFRFIYDCFLYLIFL